VKALVAGIGNIFFADDGFGVEVARRLEACSVPPGTRVADYGIRSVHLAYELLDGYELLVIVDAVPMGQPPGTVALIEVDVDDVESTGHVAIDAHTMTPTAVLGTLARLGGGVDRVLVVGCEPAVIEEAIGLSEPVSAAVAAAVDIVLSVLADAGATAGKES
jgi:hydrogenase maturation protease